MSRSYEEDVTFQPPTKQIRLEENDTDEQENVTVNETRATSRPSNTPLQMVRNRSEIRVNINSDNKPHLLPKQRGLEHWCEIGFGSLNQCDVLVKLGKIVLKLISEEIPPNANEKLKSDFTNVTIEERFPGITYFRMQVEGQWSGSTNTVQIIARREISKEDAAPMLMASKSNRRPPPKDHKYIEFKHFTYTFRSLNLPPALFGKPGKLI